MEGIPTQKYMQKYADTGKSVGGIIALRSTKEFLESGPSASILIKMSL